MPVETLVLIIAVAGVALVLGLWVGGRLSRPGPDGSNPNAERVVRATDTGEWPRRPTSSTSACCR